MKSKTKHEHLMQRLKNTENLKMQNKQLLSSFFVWIFLLILSNNFKTFPRPQLPLTNSVLINTSLVFLEGFCVFFQCLFLFKIQSRA